MTDTPPRLRETPPPIPQGSESLEVWDVRSSFDGPWIKLGTIIRKGGRNGKIVCTPESLDCLLNRPRMIGYDPMDYLTSWSNGGVAVWPKGTAPGAPTST
ncbi:MAG: hypothetical protein ACLQCU_05515 [Acidimicrobiales bacterium]